MAYMQLHAMVDRPFILVSMQTMDHQVSLILTLIFLGDSSIGWNSAASWRFRQVAFTSRQHYRLFTSRSSGCSYVAIPCVNLLLNVLRSLNKKSCSNRWNCLVRWNVKSLINRWNCLVRWNVKSLINRNVYVGQGCMQCIGCMSSSTEVTIVLQ